MNIKKAVLCRLDQPAYILRVGGQDWKLGEPYEICTTVVDRGNGIVEIQGLDKPMLPSHWRAIFNCLIEAGFVTAVFERHRPDGTVEWRKVGLIK